MLLGQDDMANTAVEALFTLRQGQGPLAPGGGKGDENAIMVGGGMVMMVGSLYMLIPAHA